VNIEDDFVPADELTHFKRTGCPGDEDLGPVEGFATVLSRTYPRAAPGRLVSIDSDPETGEARIEGQLGEDADGESTADLWVPERGGPPEVTGEGIGDVEIVEVPGGYRVLVDITAMTYAIEVAPA
jgi:endoglycosylceramidase